MRPSCWTPPARLRYEGDRPTESFDCDGAIAGPATRTAAAHSPAFLGRTRAAAGTRPWLRRRRAQGRKILAGRQSRSALAAGSHRIGFSVPTPRRVLVCQFELPLPQFVSRLLVMRRSLGPDADQSLPLGAATSTASKIGIRIGRAYSSTIWFRRRRNHQNGPPQT
jgi:hypothetical protein